MMGFDPRKWLTGAMSGLSPQQRPTVGGFTTHGDFGAATRQDAMRFRGQGNRSLGSQPGMPTPTFDQAGHAQAMKDYALDEDIRQRKLAKMAELMEYGQKDLSPRPPSHTFVGESGGVEVAWPDMIGEQSYVDLDQPIDELSSYEEEAERRRRRLLARYLA